MQQNTQLIHVGRKPKNHYGMVNPPIYQTSTILFPTIEAYEKAGNGDSCYYAAEDTPLVDLSYGLSGTPTTFALAEAIAQCEGGDHTLLVPSGLTAITLTLMAFLSPGDHVLMADNVYWPTRRFCQQDLSRMGIETTFYDPTLGAEIRSLIQKNTKMIFVESPGSLTFEIQDIPAIVAEAKARNVLVVMDNSWATPLFFKPFYHGVDIAIQAISKYIAGHADLVMGAITTTKAMYPQLYRYYKNFGISVSPHDCYTAQRGLRTMSARLQQHQATGIALAEWLEAQPEVMKVLHPALPSHPQHHLWKRDFTGACGLFSFILQPYSQEAVARMINHLTFFGIGCSWGGYESLIIRFNPSAIRTAKAWQIEGPCVRIHAGLEDLVDLKADLAEGLKQLSL